MLPKEAIDEYKKLYLARFKIELNDDEASRRANNLVNLYKFVYAEPISGPIKSSEQEQKRNENNGNTNTPY